jgi:hypothetical protein
MNKFPNGLLAAVLLFAPGSASVAVEPYPASIAMRSLDAILGPRAFDDVGLDFMFSVVQENNERRYQYVAKGAGDEVDYAIIVTFAASGRLIDQPQWQRDFDNASQADRAKDFPAIGARARVEPPLFSPDGASTSVTFTTIDGLFDVRAAVFEASSDRPRESLTARDVAERVSSVYRGTMR